MRVKHGTYTGTGSSLAITGLGFSPDLVIVRRTGNTDTGTVYMYYTTSAMPAGKTANFRGDVAYENGIITSLDSDGFTVGTPASVNYNGDTYYYLAVKDNGAGDFKVGVFTGDGNDGKAITGLGFQPDFVSIKTDYAITGAYTFSSKTSGNKGFMWWNGACRDDLFASLDADGFTVNNGSADSANLINRSGVESSYFAFKNVPNYCYVATHTGNGADNRDISLPSGANNFTPVFGLLKGDTTVKAVARFKQNTGDKTQEIDNSVVWANVIQAFGAGTYQVGSDNRANQNTIVYCGLFLADNFDTFIAGQGSFAGTMQNVTVTSARTITASKGEYNLTWINTTISKVISLLANLGSFLTTFTTTSIRVAFYDSKPVGSSTNDSEVTALCTWDQTEETWNSTEWTWDEQIGDIIRDTKPTGVYVYDTI
jgi:hypothetical protein